jgi:short subunit dehydrogenase-like uncharacterized protein
MKGTKGFAEDILIKEVTKDGVKLIVIASRSETDWELSVQNEYGISSNWLECFPSAQHAIDAGLQAIEEGIEPFIDTEGFEYLFD